MTDELTELIAPPDSQLPRIEPPTEVVLRTYRAERYNGIMLATADSLGHYRAQKRRDVVDILTVGTSHRPVWVLSGKRWVRMAGSGPVKSEKE